MEKIKQEVIKMKPSQRQLRTLVNTHHHISEKTFQTEFNMSQSESKDIIKYLQTMHLISIFRDNGAFKVIDVCKEKRLAEVCSLDNLEERLNKDIDKKALISFSDYPWTQVNIPKSIPTFQLSLLDLEFEQIDKDAEVWFSQAKSMADFIDEWYKKGYHFICESIYVDSRSPAVAAAILEHYEGQGIDIFSDFRYHPNQMIYVTLMKALAEKDGLRNIDR